MTDHFPTVDVIVPIRDGERFASSLMRRLDAMVDDIGMVIIVDDGSRDSTPSLLAAYAATRPRVLVLTNSEPQGVARSRNRAVAHASGEYVWMADADDDWDETIVSKLLAAACAVDADVVVCGAHVGAQRHRGRRIDGALAHATLDREAAWVAMMSGELKGYLWNKLFRRTSLGQQPFMDLTSQSDFTGVVRAISNARAVVMIPDILYFHVTNAGSITQRRNPDTQNLAACWDVFVTASGVALHGERTSGLAQYFYAWFVCLPQINARVRLDSTRTHVALGATSARSLLRRVSARAIWPFSKRVAVNVVAIQTLGRAYPIVLRAARRVLRTNDERKQA